MSLDDQFEPDDGGWVDRLDRLLLGTHYYVSERWKTSTGKSIPQLQAGCYIASSLGMAAWGYLISEPFAYGLSLAALARLTILPPRTSGLEMEIHDTAIGLPSKTSKVVGAVNLTALMIKSTVTAASLVYFGKESADEAVNLLPYASFTLWYSADFYLTRCMGGPRGPGKRQRLLEKHKSGQEEVGSEPIPVPVEVKS